VLASNRLATLGAAKSGRLTPDLWLRDRHPRVSATAHTEIIDMTIGMIVADLPASPHLTALPARELG
jgi:hypothetical protein